MVTLAVGDGANDVSMIQEANIGIGIFGAEGSQASQVSDYSISKFKYLRRLLAVHGHYNTFRLSGLIKYSLYKNSNYVIPLILFQIFSMFSMVIQYDAWFSTLFNIVFASVPIFIIAVYDKDIPDWMLENKPRIYKKYKEVSAFSPLVFIRWVLMGFYHAFVNFFIPYVFYGRGIVNKNGTSASILEYGVWTSTSIVLSVTFIVLRKTKYLINKLNTLFIFLSLLLYFVIMGVISLIRAFDDQFYMAFFTVFAHPQYYLSVILCLAVDLLPPLVADYISHSLFPGYRQRLMDVLTDGSSITFPHKPLEKATRNYQKNEKQEDILV
ncbi:MAG: hypothetical protein EZS28_014198 [Streblomastix strix]|uniref:P-type ATPase C-terminal domain-containing protein n=1 Tax=Streblomastix strix TaxID=222440 RepID=A0A5J4W6C6_9EUKA|nr:MAG: hypothetical protein EZS28_014198 [Streblomastix strix]